MDQMDKRLRVMALRAVFRTVLPEIDAPADMGEGSAFMRWYQDDTGEVKKPADLHAHDPYDSLGDDEVKKLILEAAITRLEEYANVLELHVEFLAAEKEDEASAALRP